MAGKLIEHIGETRLMNCGMMATMVGCFHVKIIIKFEDGTLVENKRYADFQKGSIANPTLRDLRGYHFNDFTVLEETNKSDKYKSKIWKCKCSCGNIIEIPRREILGYSSWTQPKNCGYCKNI